MNRPIKRSYYRGTVRSVLRDFKWISAPNFIVVQPPNRIVNADSIAIRNAQGNFVISL